MTDRRTFKPSALRSPLPYKRYARRQTTTRTWTFVKDWEDSSRELPTQVSPLAEIKIAVDPSLSSRKKKADNEHLDSSDENSSNSIYNTDELSDRNLSSRKEQLSENALDRSEILNAFNMKSRNINTDKKIIRSNKKRISNTSADISVSRKADSVPEKDPLQQTSDTSVKRVDGNTTRSLRSGKKGSKTSSVEAVDSFRENSDKVDPNVADKIEENLKNNADNLLSLPDDKISRNLRTGKKESTISHVKAVDSFKEKSNELDPTTDDQIKKTVTHNSDNLLSLSDQKSARELRSSKKRSKISEAGGNNSVESFVSRSDNSVNDHDVRPNKKVSKKSDEETNRKDRLKTSKINVGVLSPTKVRADGLKFKNIGLSNPGPSIVLHLENQIRHPDSDDNESDKTKQTERPVIIQSATAQNTDSEHSYLGESVGEERGNLNHKEVEERGIKQVNGDKDDSLETEEEVSSKDCKGETETQVHTDLNQNENDVQVSMNSGKVSSNNKYGNDANNYSSDEVDKTSIHQSNQSVSRSVNESPSAHSEESKQQFDESKMDDLESDSQNEDDNVVMTNDDETPSEKVQLSTSFGKRQTSSNIEPSETNFSASKRPKTSANLEPYERNSVMTEASSSVFSSTSGTGIKKHKLSTDADSDKTVNVNDSVMQVSGSDVMKKPASKKLPVRFTSPGSPKLGKNKSNHGPEHVVPMWCGGLHQRYKKDIMDLDIVLDCVSDSLTKERDNCDTEAEKKAVKRLILYMKKEITDTIDKVESVKTLGVGMKSSKSNLKELRQQLVKAEQEKWKLTSEITEKKKEFNENLHSISDWICGFENLMKSNSRRLAKIPKNGNLLTYGYFPAVT